LVDARVAESPFAFVACVTFPVTRVGERIADVAEHPRLQSIRRIVFANKRAWGGGRSGEEAQWSSVSMAYENMGGFMVWRISVRWCLSFVSGKCGPAEAKPVLAAFACAIAVQTEIVWAVIAAWAVVVEVIFDVLFPAMITR
jgi:hypothetical protein